MIRRSILTLLAGLFFSLMSLPSLAVGTTFSETFDRDYYTTTSSYLTIYDNIDFSDNFNLYKSNAIITDIELKLNFSGTNADLEANENWWTLFPASTDNSFALKKTDSTTFVDQIFNLTASELNDLIVNFSNDNIFILKFYEKTQNKEVDSFFLNSASLLVNYQAVPIPGAALLLGSALLGVVAVRRRLTA